MEGKHRMLEEDWMKKNLVSIAMNLFTIIAVIIFITIFIIWVDVRATRNEAELRNKADREVVYTMVSRNTEEICNLEESIALFVETTAYNFKDHERRIQNEELFRREAIIRLEYISTQIDRLRIEIKEHDEKVKE